MIEKRRNTYMQNLAFHEEWREIYRTAGKLNCSSQISSLNRKA